MSQAAAEVDPAGPSSALQSGSDANDVKGKRKLSHGRGPLLGDSDDDSLPPDERTRLLPASRPTKAPGSVHSPRSQLTWKRGLCWILVAILLISIALLITVHILMGHLWAKRLRDDESLRRYGEKALVIEGPDAFSIDSFQDDGIRGRVRLRAGVDLQRAFVDEKPLDFVERQLIRWGRRVVPNLDVRLPEEIQIESQDGRLQLAIVTAKLPSSVLSLPVRWRPKGSWLKSVDQEFAVRIPRPEQVASFLDAAWERKKVDVRLSAENVQVVARGRYLQIGRTLDVGLSSSTDLPDLPGLTHLSDLVNLRNYSIAPVRGQQLGLNARATLINPLTNATLSPLFERLLNPIAHSPIAIPWQLPFSVSIRGSNHSVISMAHVSILPFKLAHGFRQSPIDLDLSGIFVPENNASDEALSTFLARFLLGLDNPVVVHYAPGDVEKPPPEFFTPLLARYPVQLRFPGAPDDERHLLQDVKIENMRISLGDGTSDLRASGNVVGQLKLPKELAGLADADALAIRAVMPDIYVYDGKPPPAREGGSTPGDGRPPASNAFARLRSDTYLPAQTERGSDEQGENVTLVHARIDNAPLDLLPGRGDVFRRYMGKVLFGTGDGPEGKVSTGVRGVCAVNATIEGFGHVELHRLPVEGDFFVGKGDARLADFLLAGLLS